MNWNKPYSAVRNHVVRIETPNGSGTGFLFGYNATGDIAAIATAAHVVADCHDWRQPIKLIHEVSGDEVFIEHGARAVLLDRRRDSASIMFKSNTLPLPKQALELMDSTHMKRVGVELGWVGYPSVAYPRLCFFTGCVSAAVSSDDYYLIDGVAINGVSGGPVFDAIDENSPQIVGTISAYMPNRVSGSTLPGLLRAQDITAFHETLQRIKSLDEARAKEAEKEAADAAAAQANPGSKTPSGNDRDPAAPTPSDTTSQ